MKYLILSLATLIYFAIWAQPGANFYDDLRQQEHMPQFDFGEPLNFVRVDSVYNASLSDNEVVYHFQFENLLEEDSIPLVQYSIDSILSEAYLIDGVLSLQATPEPHLFKFYLNSNYLEVFSPVLQIPSRNEYTYAVYLLRRAPQAPVMTFKPVIYLYPQEETEVEVNLEIHDGKHPFYYPAYNENWNCMASPNGDLTINGEKYRYLFWEAQQEDHLNEIEVNEGFVVEGKGAIAFLESHLNTFGFTAAERADFITFWGPKMAANEHNLVRFEWNETCDKFADLNISPQPDNIYRFYIFTSALESDYDIQPQIIPTMNRDGFTVLEWGGQISNYQPTKVL